MTLVTIDLGDVAGGHDPDDHVIIRAENFRESPGGGITSTAEVKIPLVDGVGQAEVEPGPVVVSFRCKAVADTREKRGVVPDVGPVGVEDVIGGSFEYTPAVVNRGLGLIEGALDEALGEVETAVAAEVDSIKWTRRTIGAGEDINSLSTPGVYWVNSQTVAAGLVGAPTDGAAYGPAIITVTSTALGSILQRWEVISSLSSATFTRRRTSGGVWSDWLRFDRDVIASDFAKKADLTSLATKSEVTSQVQAASWSKSAISNDADLNTYVAPGVYWVNSQTVAGSLVNRPDFPRTISPAILEVKATVAGGGWIHQTWTSLNLPGLDSPVLTRRRTSGGVWSDWEIENTPPPTPPPTPVVSGSENRPGSGYKIVPLSVTLGNSGVTHLGTTGHYRFPLLWNAPVTRWRMCVTTRRPRQGDLSGAHVRLDAVTMGDHAGQGAFTTTPTLVAENVEVPLDGSIVRLPWITGQIGANVERLLGVKYTSLNGVGPLSLNGECYDMGTADPTDTSATGIKKGSGPLDIWIEAETYATTPVFAAIGDSTSCGAGATRSTNDGWINVWARQIGALPIHYANSGDTAQSWAGSIGGYKQTRWLDLAPPDAVIFALGNNDFAGTANLADMQSRILAMMPDMLNISPNLYAATTKPRAVGKIPEEQVQRRNEYNAWLMSERTIFRDAFDWAESVGGDYLDPAFDSGDGIHLNSAGYAQLADAMRAVTTPPARSSRELIYTGTGTPLLSDFPDAQIGDYIVRKSDGQEWRVDE